MLEGVLDVEMLDERQHHDGDGGGEDHAEEAKEKSARHDGEERDDGREFNRPALHERRDEIALNLLDRDVDEGGVERDLRTFGEREEEAGDGRDDRPDERDELEQAHQQT